MILFNSFLICLVFLIKLGVLRFSVVFPNNFSVLAEPSDTTRRSETYTPENISRIVGPILKQINDMYASSSTIVIPSGIPSGNMFLSSTQKSFKRTPKSNDQPKKVMTNASALVVFGNLADLLVNQKGLVWNLGPNFTISQAKVLKRTESNRTVSGLPERKAKGITERSSDTAQSLDSNEQSSESKEQSSESKEQSPEPKEQSSESKEKSSESGPKEQATELKDQSSESSETKDHSAESPELKGQSSDSSDLKGQPSNSSSESNEPSAITQSTAALNGESTIQPSDKAANDSSGAAPSDGQETSKTTPEIEQSTKKLTKEDLHVGSSVEDHVHDCDIIFKEIPIKKLAGIVNISDETFESLAESVPDRLDFSQEKVYSGKEAAEKLRLSLHGNATFNETR